MEGGIRLEHPVSGRSKAGRVSALYFGVLLLLGVVAGLAWLCMGVTRWGRYTLLGPGYAGRVKVAGYDLRVTRGWNRSVDVDFAAFSLGMRLPIAATAFTPAADPFRLLRAGGPARPSLVCTYHAGFVLITENVDGQLAARDP